MIKPHKKLNVWQLAMVIVEDVYNLTDTFPANERFGLTSQLRRCAVSVPSNIAEGAARNTTKEFINFLHIAQGSLSELDTQLEISFRLKLINQEILFSLDSKLLQVDQMISGLISSLKKTPNS
jgi:four helix bundle protein